MRSRRGIALVASLAVLAVVAMVGVGSYFLANVNLRIASNTRSHVIARYNAESGLDHALIIAAREFRNSNGVLPAEDQFSTFFSGVPQVLGAQVVGYERYSDTEATVQVRGFGPNGAEYVAEARFKGVATPSEVVTSNNPLFGVGFVTNGTVKFPGNSTLDLNIWAGDSIDFPGGKSQLGSGFWARSAGGDGATCQIGKTRCQTDYDPPNVTAPDFTALRAEIITRYRALLDPDDLVADMPDLSDLCTMRISGSTSRANLTSAIVCLEPGAQLTLIGKVSNVVVIGDVSTTVLLKADTAPLDAEGKGLGVTIVSGKVDLSDKNTTMQGENTIVAKADIEFNKGVLSVDDSARTLIATEGNVLLNGNGGRDIYASFWTGGTYRINGTQGDFVGTVVAASGSIAITGKGGVDHARLPDSQLNPFIPTVTTVVSYGDAGILVLSRR